MARAYFTTIEAAQQEANAQETLNIYQEYSKLTDVQKQALFMIQHKVARIIAGSSNVADHWHDIQGYAKLAEDRCK